MYTKMIEYNPEKLSEIYRRDIAQKKKFVVKVGTEVITGDDRRLKEGKIKDIAKQSAILHRQGKVITIVSSGAIAGGMGKIGVTEYDAKDIVMSQTLAAFGQPSLMAQYEAQFKTYGMPVAQVLLTYSDLTKQPYIQNFRNTLEKINELGGIAVLNENDPVSIDELIVRNNEMGNNLHSPVRFGDNDTLAVMVAEVLEADVLFMLMKEEGIMNYEEKRKIDIVYDVAGAERYFHNSQSPVTKGGIFKKGEVSKRAQENGKYVILANGTEDDVILRILEGEPLGTLIPPKSL